MSIPFANLRQHRWLAGLLVVALALRALIPVGFMPSGNGQFALQICPEGFPAFLLQGSGHHHHHEGHDSSEAPAGHDHKSWMQGHCPFGAAAGAPSACQSAAVNVDLRPVVPLPEMAVAAALRDFRFLIAQPRAPPARFV